MTALARVMNKPTKVMDMRDGSVVGKGKKVVRDRHISSSYEGRNGKDHVGVPECATHWARGYRSQPLLDPVSACRCRASGCPVGTDVTGIPAWCAGCVASLPVWLEWRAVLSKYCIHVRFLVWQSAPSWNEMGAD